MIELKHLTKRFAQHTVVNDLSFRVAPGEVLGFLGPNGAGKSTLFKAIMGFVPVAQGQIRILGHPVREAVVTVPA